jgi:type IV pilus assembly protein PilC
MSIKNASAMATKALNANDLAMRRALARRQPMQSQIVSSNKVPSKTLNVFTRQWAALMRAGIPLAQAFDLLSQSAVGSSSVRKHFASTLHSLRTDVLSGQSLHKAFQKHPKVFDALYCNLLHAGESAGILEKVLSRLADSLEAQALLKAKLKNAIIYPCSILVVSCGVITVIMLWVIPIFEEVFKSMGASLPWATQCLVDASHLVSEWSWAIGLAMALLVLLSQQLHIQSLSFRMASEHAMFALPVLGPLCQAAMNVRWAHSLSALLEAGMPLANAVFPAGGATLSPNIQSFTPLLAKQLQEGNSLHKAMSKSGLFSPMLVQMCAIGEETGSLDNMLLRAAQLMESDVNQGLGNLSTLLEPILMVVLGTLIGGILIALYLPIFNIGQVF